MMRKLLSWAIVATVVTFAIGSTDAEARCRRMGRRCYQTSHCCVSTVCHTNDCHMHGCHSSGWNCGHCQVPGCQPTVVTSQP